MTSPGGASGPSRPPTGCSERLQEHDRAAIGTIASAKSTERRPSVAAEVGERRRRGLDRAAVPTGIGHEQDEHLNPAIPLLAVQPALEGLQVVENGLRLDGDPPPSTLDQQVPGS